MLIKKAKAVIPLVLKSLVVSGAKKVLNFLVAFRLDKINEKNINGNKEGKTIAK